ncbi:MAG: hypothetical protein N2504_00215 [candidate division WOR-3 bacterium]|nr:hypothetical protein [candidate division WOR-3 bacterium]MCX7947003.1 hypothetical protein [candidate division WOR-3 bacterium]MDW8149956.1 hypothetical protein [candidate division WOR-3 bacterium]
MKILNLSKNIKIKESYNQVNIDEFPDVVIADNNYKELYEISLNFTTITIGSSNLQTIDYSFENEDDLNNFLEVYSKKTIRQRMIEFYNKYYAINDLKPANVNFVCYYGKTDDIYRKLEILLNSEYEPWILIYGQRGVGKYTIIRSIIGDRAVDYFEIEEKEVGFRKEKEKTKSIIIMNIDLFESILEFNFAVNSIYKKKGRIVFITDNISPPINLSTVPSIYIPSISERNHKEKLLILEHFLRNITNEMVEIEEDFYRAYLTYPWFGNFSEIENAIRYALSIEKKLLKFKNLPIHIKAFFEKDYNLNIIDFFSKIMLFHLRSISYNELKQLTDRNFKNIIRFIYEFLNNDLDRLLEVLNVKNGEEIKEIKAIIHE